MASPKYTDSERGLISALAYEYSRQEEYQNSSPEENWCRAEVQLGFSKLGEVSFLEKQAERIRPASDFVGRLLTLSAGSSAILTAAGLVLLVSYLRKVGAPMPPIDSSTGLFVFGLAAVSFAFSGLLHWVAVLPVFRQIH